MSQSTGCFCSVSDQDEWLNNSRALPSPLGVLFWEGTQDPARLRMYEAPQLDPLQSGDANGYLEL